MTLPPSLLTIAKLPKWAVVLCCTENAAMLPMSAVEPVVPLKPGADPPAAQPVLSQQQKIERAAQVARATNEFATEALLHVCCSASASCRAQSGSHDSEEVRRQTVIRNLAPTAGWTQAGIDHHLSVVMGRCDISTRSSPCTDQRVARHNHFLADAKKCKVVPESEVTVGEFGFVELFDDIFTSQALPLEYGVRCGWEAECNRLRRTFAEAVRLRMAILELVSKHSLLSRSGVAGLHDYPDTVGEAVQILRRRIANNGNSIILENNRNRFWGLVIKCSTLMSTSKSKLKAFENRVQLHVEARRNRADQFFSYNFLGQDIVLAIADFVGYKYIPRVLLLGTAFSRDDGIKKLLPHLSVRCVPGLFPHGTESIPGIGHCSVVSKNTHVHVVIDLAITGTRRSGISYSTDQHASESAGWSDNPVSIKAERRARYVDEQERRMRKFDEESTSGERFRMRLGARRLFCCELQCSVTLVYADTHLQVNPGSPNAVISIPHSMAVRSTSMNTYTARDSVPYPAYTALNVMHLSTKHSNRLYKLKVVAKGWYKSADGGAQPKLTKKILEAYSAPFAVVSTKKAFKRKRASAEQAR